MTAYTLTPVGINGPIERLSRRVEGWDLRLVEENVRLRAELDEARREAAGAQRLKERIEIECANRVRIQQRLFKVALALATITHRCPEAGEQVVAAREEIWGSDV